MEQSLNVRFVMMRAGAEKKAAQSPCLGVEHLFLGLLKLAELTADQMFNAPEAVKREEDRDIAEVKRLFAENGIDTTRTRGHLRYMMSGGAAAGDLLMERCLKQAEEACAAAGRTRLSAQALLEAILRNPSDLILQVCPIERRDEDQAAGVNEMSIDFLPELTARIRRMRARLLSAVFGQDHVVHAFAEGMFAAEVLAASDEKRVRPRAVFVFAGPPGVGKTFLAEQAAAALDLPFKRFDMTSYADHQSYMGLIGFEKSFHEAKKGTLTGFVRSNPHSILLFDEIEKAHANTVNLFLQILDAGRLNDRFLDEDVSFKDTILIFTTNAGQSLYDGASKENAAGVSRGIILEALNTELNPQTGKPQFPPAITSRMAAGWPLLFNHLQAQHLEKISAGELNKLCALFEKQYGIKPSFDATLPTALLLQEGGRADARTLRAQTELFFKNEVFKICRLWGEEHFTSAINAIERISFRARLEEAPGEVAELFRSSEKPEMLLYASRELAERFRRKLPQYTVYASQNVEEALSIAGEKDVRLALIHLPAGSVAGSADRLQRSSLSVEAGAGPGQGGNSFDYSPITDASISDGNRLFRALRERLPEIPLYLLEGEDFTVDPELEMSFIRAGARGKLKIPEGELSVFDDQLASICRELYMQRVAARLAAERKTLAFETVPRLRGGGREVEIRLCGFAVKRAVSAEDSGSVLDEVEKPALRFSDVIGAKQAKDELQFFVEYLRNPKRFSAQGLRPPKGVLLYGPPGTGKTMLARAMAGECDVAFLPAVASSFVTKYQGSGPESVRSLFQRARRYAPSIIFIDELDAIGRKRGQSNSGHGEEMALNALLAEMDGFAFDPRRPVFVLAATNYEVEEGRGGMGVIDPALSRRFDCKVLVDLPNEEEREAFLRMALGKLRTHRVSEPMIKRIAARSVGVSPSWLSSVMEMGNRLAVKAGGVLDDAALDEAYETVMHGSRKDWGVDYLERVARHEAGHALMNSLSGNTPVYLTIIARGDHGGYMEHAAAELGPLLTRRELLERIRCALGGRAAELVCYGEEEGLSTGAGSDLRSATRLAAAMLTDYGMDRDFGLAAPGEGGALSPKLRGRINEILQREMETAVRAVREHRRSLDRLVEALLKKNKLTAEEIQSCLKE